jgi:signal transduction histidine kinase
LSVADMAAGIAAADHAGRFQQFERGRSQAGSGFGLSLVRSLVELHGGSVEIESAPGRENRVTCRLPVGALDPGGGAAPAAAEGLQEPADSPCEVAA